MELPDHYLITPKPEDDDSFLAALERTLEAGTRLLQFRAKGIEPERYRTLAAQVIELAHRNGCRVLLNGEAELVVQLGADGLHLDSRQAAGYEARPLDQNYLLAVSAHNLEALQQGEALGASFGVLSPINYTSAHPDIEPIGWEGLKEMVARLTMPLYALGGVTAMDGAAARAVGAQGVAGNRGYWQG